MQNLCLPDSFSGVWQAFPKQTLIVFNQINFFCFGFSQRSCSKVQSFWTSYREKQDTWQNWLMHTRKLHTVTYGGYKIINFVFMIIIFISMSDFHIGYFVWNNISSSQLLLIITSHSLLFLFIHFAHINLYILSRYYKTLKMGLN